MRKTTLSAVALIAGLALPMAAAAEHGDRGRKTVPVYREAQHAPLRVIRQELHDLRYRHDRLLRRADRAWRRGNPYRAWRLRSDARDVRRKIVRLERRHDRIRHHRRHARSDWKRDRRADRFDNRRERDDRRGRRR